MSPTSPKGLEHLNRRSQRCIARAQATVELALIAPIAIVLMLVGVQYAILGVAALGLGQADYQAARWAAVNTSAGQSGVSSYVLSQASPIITANNGQYLTVSVNSASPCTFGNSVSVALTFDLNHLVVLPNPFMGMVTFPSSISNTESAMCE